MLRLSRFCTLTPNSVTLNGGKRRLFHQPRLKSNGTPGWLEVENFDQTPVRLTNHVFRFQFQAFFYRWREVVCATH